MQVVSEAIGPALLIGALSIFVLPIVFFWIKDLFQFHLEDLLFYKWRISFLVVRVVWNAIFIGFALGWPSWNATLAAWLVVLLGILFGEILIVAIRIVEIAFGWLGENLPVAHRTMARQILRGTVKLNSRGRPVVPRKFSLWLRPFSLDADPHLRSVYNFEVLDPYDIYNSIPINPEEHLELEMLHRHPLIAIGDDPSSLQGHAPRIAIDDEQWRNVVALLLKRAKWVVFVPADSVGVMWELDHITSDSDFILKTLFVIPRQSMADISRPILEDIEGAAEAAGVLERFFDQTVPALKLLFEERRLAWPEEAGIYRYRIGRGMRQPVKIADMVFYDHGELVQKIGDPTLLPR